MLSKFSFLGFCYFSMESVIVVNVFIMCYHCTHICLWKFIHVASFLMSMLVIVNMVNLWAYRVMLAKVITFKLMSLCFLNLCAFAHIAQLCFYKVMLAVVITFQLMSSCSKLQLCAWGYVCYGQYGETYEPKSYVS